jgi:hypothetical protein
MQMTINQPARRVALGLVLLVGSAGAATTASAATDSAVAMPALFKNCTNLNNRYPHGIGKLTARDSTSRDPVTNFKRSTLLYNRAMSYNRGLDRDKDGIACEQK